MRTVIFKSCGTNANHDIIAHYMRGDVVVDVRCYYMPADHCTIGPDIRNFIDHDYRPNHSAPHAYKPCNVVTPHIGRDH